MPTQATGKKVDARSDVPSFASLLYEMVTGRRAFAGASRQETLAAVVATDPRPPSEIAPGVPAELEMYQEAVAEAKAIFSGDPEIVDALSSGYVERGYAEANRQAAERLAMRNPLTGWESENVSILFAFARQEARALDWLERGYQTHESMMSFIGIDPHWDDLRSEPRFQRLLQRLKLPQARASVPGQ